MLCVCNHSCYFHALHVLLAGFCINTSSHSLSLGERWGLCNRKWGQKVRTESMANPHLLHLTPQSQEVGHSIDRRIRVFSLHMYFMLDRYQSLVNHWATSEVHLHSEGHQSITQGRCKNTWYGVTDTFTSPLQIIGKRNWLNSSVATYLEYPRLVDLVLAFLKAGIWLASNGSHHRNNVQKFDPGSEIPLPLWCDVKFDGKKEQWWSTGSRVTLIKAREKGNYNTDNISLEFQDKHANKFSGSQYNLWDRLIENCQWDNVEWPANVAHPWHYTAQILQKESTTEVIANTAVAIVNIFKVHHRPIQVTQRSDPWYPPRKKAKLRKKYLISSKESRNSGMMPTLIKEKFKQEK